MNKEIIVQVAFKGAIECVTNANTESEVKDVRSLTKLFTEIMISEIGDYKPQQAQSTSYSSSGSSKPITEKQKTLFLGNLYSKRDWGHARDFVYAMWLILQQKKPDDFVISTGKQITVKNFVNFVSKNLKIKIKWKGRGINEKAVDEKGNVIVACNRAYYRPLEVNSLLGDSRKARRTLGWKPKVNVNELISDMVNTELKKLST